MATQGDSPWMFAGQPWSTWAEIVPLEDDHDSSKEKDHTQKKDDVDFMRLRKDDMPSIGRCPAQDEFYLVVCDKCNQVIKPQAFKKHMVLRHDLVLPLPKSVSRTSSKSTVSSAKSSMSSRSKSSVSKTSPSSKTSISSSKSVSHTSVRISSNLQKEQGSGLKGFIPLSVDTKFSGSSERNSDLVKCKLKTDHSPRKAEQPSPRKNDHASPRRTDHTPIKTENTNIRSELTPPPKVDHTPPRRPDNTPPRRHDHTPPRRPDHTPPRRPDHTPPRRVDHSSPKMPEHTLRRTDHTPPPTKASVKQMPDSLDQSKLISSLNTVSKSCKVKKNHSMPVVKVERMPEQVSIKKSVTVCPENSAKSPQSVANGNTKSDSGIGSMPNTPTTPVSQPLILPPSVAQSTLVLPLPPPPPLMSVATLTATTTVVTMTCATTVVSSTVCSTTSINSSMTTTTVMPSTAPTTVNNSTVSNRKSPKERKFVPLKDREYDANKHCGVKTGDMDKPCTRSLTCKSHALSLRRSVPGRRKSFDDLLKEHREAKEALLKLKAEKSKTLSSSKSSLLTPNSSPVHTVQHELGGDRDLQQSPRSSCLLSPTKKLSHPFLRPLNSVFHNKPGQLTHPLLSPPIREEHQPPYRESNSRTASDGEGDDEGDDNYLSYHPRPAAVCTFGARYTEGGCYTFNRRTDYLRAAFFSALERHLHPPPHKKLCVESNLPKEPQIISESKDPYEFTFDNSLSSAPSGINRMLNSANKCASKPKSKTSPSGKTSKTKTDSVNPGSSPVLTGTSNLNSGNCQLKRKRSAGSPVAMTTNNVVTTPSTSTSTSSINVVGSIAVPSVQQTVTHSPFTAIAIPNNISLQTATLGQINASNLSTNKQLPKNNVVKDGVGIVLTGLDSRFNGQYVSITGPQLTDLTGVQNLPVEDKCVKKNRTLGASVGKTITGKIQSSLDNLKVLQPNSRLTALCKPQNTMYIDGGTFLTPLSIAPSGTGTFVNISNSVSSQSQPSPSLSTHSQFFRSGSAGSQISVSPPVTVINGVIPSPSDKSSCAGLVKHNTQLQKTSSKTIHIPTVSQLITAPATTATNMENILDFSSNPVLTSNTLRQVQVKPETLNLASKNLSSKMAMQPVSVHFPGLAGIGTVPNQQQTTHTLFVQTTSADSSKQELHLQQVSNSPSNVIS